MEGKRVFITGSSRGIGEKILEKFASNGCHVYAHARTYSEEFEEKLRVLREKYEVEIEPVYFELTDSDAMKTAMKEVIRARKGIDVLVNNAGRMHAGLFQMTDLDTIREVFDVNLFAVMELTQWVLKVMTRKKSGSIVNLSSITGLDLGIGQCAYGVSKAAVAAFTATLAAETGNYGIRVNAVAPGIAKTRMADAQEVQAERERLENGKGALSRLAKPEEIADAVYFLASEEASFINGQVLRVDGGNRIL